jgi:hypothetical protein
MIRLIQTGMRNIAAYRRHWRWQLSIVIPIAFAPLIACIPFGDAVAQICTVSSSSVTLGSGSCSISPNTTLQRISRGSRDHQRHRPSHGLVRSPSERPAQSPQLNR